MARSRRDIHWLLAPNDASTFLTEIWGQESLWVPGAEEKFEGLFSWDELNRILTEHRLEPPRLRLELEGHRHQELEFLRFRSGRRGGQIPRLLPSELYQHLRAGATLVLDAVDEMCPSVRQLAEELAGQFLTHIQVNLYAAWGTSEGFGLHWDDHDVIITQVAGRKRWKLFRDTRKFPLYRDIEPNTNRPSDPLWEREVSAGDLIYIPRGHWHTAQGLGEPTLHLTFGINNPTGIDFLNWIGDNLMAEEVFRQDLPIYASSDRQRDYVEKISQLLGTKLSHGSFNQYIEYRRGAMEPRPKVALPHVATTEILPTGRSFSVRYSGSTHSALLIDEEAEQFSFRALGKEWSFRLIILPLVVRLLSGEICSFLDLQGEMPDSVSEESVRALLRTLLIEGLINLDPIP